MNPGIYTFILQSDQDTLKVTKYLYNSEYSISDTPTLVIHLQGVHMYVKVYIHTCMYVCIYIYIYIYIHREGDGDGGGERRRERQREYTLFLLTPTFNLSLGMLVISL